MRLTYVFIIICLIVYASEVYLDYSRIYPIEQLFNDFGFSYEALTKMHFWVFFTSIFLHADIEHLILNMIALFFFGRVIEDALGPKKVFLIFFASGIIGNISVLVAGLVGIMSINVATIGASAAVFGLLGTAMLAKPLEFVFYPYLIPIPVVLVALLYTLYNVSEFLITVARGTPSDIAYIAHIGGLAMGILFGLKEEGMKRGFLVLGLIILILLLIPFLISIFEILELTNYLAFITGVFK